MKKYKVLVSQPKPQHGSSPYLRLANSYGLDLHFKKFVQLIPIHTEQFREYKSLISDHSALIFTSRIAIDHFFNLCKSIDLELNPDMKFFCNSVQTANYLQKYTQYKKRKVFIGDKTIDGMFPLFKKHKTEKYIFPCSEIRSSQLCTFFKNNKFPFYDMTIYKTKPNDLSDIDIHTYDIVTFFSPFDVTSFFDNFSKECKFKQIFATYGPKTAQILQTYGLSSGIQAPTIRAPSIAKAIELYISSN